MTTSSNRHRGFAFVSALSLAAACASVCAAPPGIMSHWTFDQTGAPVATDSVGGFNGTLAGGAAMVVGGVSGGAVQLTATSGGHVDMGNIYPLIHPLPWTMTAWIKMAAPLNSFMAPISRHTSGTFNGYFLAINPSNCYGTANHAWSYRSTGCGGEANATSIVNDGQWHFLAVTFHPTTGDRVYVDGGPFEGFSNVGGVAANSARFLVGGYMIGATPTGAFTGLIDDVQVYGRALRCADINAMYLNPGSEAPSITPDLNGDGEVDGADLGILLGTWGTPASDLNGDGLTDGADLGILLGAWGSC